MSALPSFSEIFFSEVVISEVVICETFFVKQTNIKNRIFLLIFSLLMVQLNIEYNWFNPRLPIIPHPPR